MDEELVIVRLADNTYQLSINNIVVGQYDTLQEAIDAEKDEIK